MLRSVDAGSHFTNFNTGLPTSHSFYPKTIALVRDSKDAAYIGLANAGGVYYRDSTLSSWVPYNSGLPNVSVYQLEIDYCAGKIRAATYGRDIWQTDPYQPLNVPPVANAIYATSTGSCNDTITFADRSDFNPTAWQWYFPGGQPASSTSPNPVVIYPSGSNNTATFIASNSSGADTVSYNIQTNYCTGINQLAIGNVVSVYPNPSNGNFTVAITGETRGRISIALINNLGQTIYQRAYNKDADIMTTECSFTGLAKGFYYLHLTSDAGNSVQKILIDELTK